LVESAELLVRSEAVRETYSITDIKQKIEHFENLLSTTPPGTERHRDCLYCLERWYVSKFRLTDNILDIEESIKYCRLSLDGTHASDPWRSNPLQSLCRALRFMFDKTGNISYLNESITIGYEILECKIPPMFHFRVNQQLALSLLTREQLLGQ
jgi:hypothetical protein